MTNKQLAKLRVLFEEVLEVDESTVAYRGIDGYVVTNLDLTWEVKVPAGNWQMELWAGDVRFKDSARPGYVFSTRDRKIYDEIIPQDLATFGQLGKNCGIINFDEMYPFRKEKFSVIATGRGLISPIAYRKIKLVREENGTTIIKAIPKIEYKDRGICITSKEVTIEIKKDGTTESILAYGQLRIDGGVGIDVNIYALQGKEEVALTDAMDHLGNSKWENGKKDVVIVKADGTESERFNELYSIKGTEVIHAIRNDRGYDGKVILFNDSHGVVDKNGEILRELKYFSICNIGDTGLFALHKRDGNDELDVNKKIDIIDSSGKLAVPEGTDIRYMGHDSSRNTNIYDIKVVGGERANIETVMSDGGIDKLWKIATNTLRG